MTPLEFVAHDIICICKYGSTGGSASAAELRLVTNYLRKIGTLPSDDPIPLPRVAVAIPKVNNVPVLVMHRPDAPTVQIATPPVTIKLPGAS